MLSATTLVTAVWWPGAATMGLVDFCRLSILLVLVRTVCGPRGGRVKRYRSRHHGSRPPDGFELSQSPSPTGVWPPARCPGERCKGTTLASRALPLAGRWSGGQARDESDQIAGHPLRLLPQHEVTGVVVHHKSRARDGGGERFLVLLNQQVVALSPDDQGGYGDRSHLCRRHCGRQSDEGFAPHVGRHPKTVIDSVLDVPAWYVMEAGKPFHGCPHPCPIDGVGEPVDLVGERRPAAQAAW